MNWYHINAAAESTAEISIYGPIGGYGITAATFAADLKRITAPNITLRIHSPGGNILEGHAIFNAIQRHSAKVTSVVDGMAASMATVVALAASRVQIAANGIWMIHNPNGASEGSAKDMRELAAILEKLAAQILDTYERKTGKPRAEIAALMDAETWMNAEEALAFGFVDEIIPAKKASAAIAADFDLSAFAHPPARPDNPAKAIYDEYLANMAAHRAAEAAALWEAHQDTLLGYAAQLARQATTQPADVEMLRAELSARDQAIISLNATLKAKDAEIAQLHGQAKTVSQRAAEIAASHGSLPASKDASEARRHRADNGAAIYRHYQALMEAGKGKEAAAYWHKNEAAILAYAASLETQNS